MDSQKAIFGRIRPKLGPSFNLDDDQYVSNNLLKLNVFYEHLLLKNIKESSGYTVSLHRSYSTSHLQATLAIVVTVRHSTEVSADPYSVI